MSGKTNLQRLLRHAPSYYVYVNYIILIRKQSYRSRRPPVGVDVRSPSNVFYNKKNDSYIVRLIEILTWLMITIIIQVMK